MSARAGHEPRLPSTMVSAILSGFTSPVARGMIRA
jgi:hypothetical protein